MAQLGRNPLTMQQTQETWVQSMGQEDPWSKEWLPTAIFLPNPMDRGVWWVQTWCCKELGMTEHVAHTYKRVLGKRHSHIRLANGRIAAKTQNRRWVTWGQQPDFWYYYMVFELPTHSAWNSPHSKTSKSQNTLLHSFWCAWPIIAMTTRSW